MILIVLFQQQTATWNCNWLPSSISNSKKKSADQYQWFKTHQNLTTYGILSCGTEVELANLGYREMERKKMKVNHGMLSISGTHTDKLMDIDRLLLWDILGILDSKILYLFMLQRQEDTMLLFQFLLNLNENRIATKHLQSIYLIFVRVLGEANYDGTE